MGARKLTPEELSRVMHKRPEPTTAQPDTMYRVLQDSDRTNRRRQSVRALLIVFVVIPLGVIAVLGGLILLKLVAG